MGNEVCHVVNKAKELLDYFLGGQPIKEVEEGCKDMRLEGRLAFTKVDSYKINFFFFSNFHFFYRMMPYW